MIGSVIRDPLNSNRGVISKLQRMALIVLFLFASMASLALSSSSSSSEPMERSNNVDFLVPRAHHVISTVYKDAGLPFPDLRFNRENGILIFPSGYDCQVLEVAGGAIVGTCSFWKDWSQFHSEFTLDIDGRITGKIWNMNSRPKLLSMAEDDGFQFKSGPVKKLDS